MKPSSRPIREKVLIAIRRIIRAVDLHSKKLVTHHGITGPQLVVLTELGRRGETSIGPLADVVNLSQATVTGILDRLENRGLVVRVRSTTDRRRVFVSLTSEGRLILEQTPPLLQERFLSRFNRLEDWEQTSILSSLQRVVSMMEAEEIDAAAVLASGPMNAAPPTATGEAASDIPVEKIG